MIPTMQTSSSLATHCRPQPRLGLLALGSGTGHAMPVVRLSYPDAISLEEDLRRFLSRARLEPLAVLEEFRPDLLPAIRMAQAQIPGAPLPRLLSHPVTLQFGTDQSCRCIIPGPTATSRAHIRSAWSMDAPVPIEAACNFRAICGTSRLYLVAFAIGPRLNPGACFLKTSISFRPAAGPAA